VSGVSGLKQEISAAARDFRDSIKQISLASALAWHDVKAKYRGSVLGPWWITITMAALIGGLTLLNSQLFSMSARDYLPWIAVGFLGWNFIATALLEGADTFIAATGILRQASIPMMVFVIRVMLRNLIYFAHNVVVIIAAAVIFGFWQKANIPLGLVGLALISINLGWVVIILGVTSARFRDVPQIVVSIMQLALFMTPVFWLPGKLSKHRIILEANPFYYMLDVLRSPLIGQPMDPKTIPVLITVAIVGWILAFGLFTATRRRIVHFL
jgi:ABC-type polysaccharide/polyol phosphate export permease